MAILSLSICVCEKPECDSNLHAYGHNDPLRTRVSLASLCHSIFIYFHSVIILLQRSSVPKHDIRSRLVLSIVIVSLKIIRKRTRYSGADPGLPQFPDTIFYQIFQKRIYVSLRLRVQNGVSRLISTLCVNCLISILCTMRKLSECYSRIFQTQSSGCVSGLDHFRNFTNLKILNI